MTIRNLLSAAAVLGALVTPCFAQSNLTGVTREPDAYNTWKLALTPGTATDPAIRRAG
jgi:hypothetical protein